MVLLLKVFTKDKTNILKGLIFMLASKVLEMLNQGRIEELKIEQQDEIYKNSLLSKTDAKKRYASMKRYLKNIYSSREDRSC